MGADTLTKVKCTGVTLNLFGSYVKPLITCIHMMDFIRTQNLL